MFVKRIIIMSIVAHGCFSEVGSDLGRSDTGSSSGDTSSSSAMPQDSPERRRETPGVETSAGESTSVDSSGDNVSDTGEIETGSDSGSSSTGDDICSHEPCAAGEALSATCDPCVALICKLYDPSCCASYWDDGCTTKYNFYCDEACL